MAGGCQRSEDSTRTAPQLQDRIADDLSQPEIEIDVVGKSGMFEVVQLRELRVWVVRIGV